MKKIHDFTILPKAARAFTIRKGQTLRIIDVEGGQVADSLFYNLRDPNEKFRASFTRMMNAGRGKLPPSGEGKLNIGKGDTLYSDRDRAMFTIIEDTYGSHDCGLAGMCRRTLYERKLKIKRDGCYELLQKALRKRIPSAEIVDPFTFFMTTKVDGSERIVITGPDTKLGDHVDLRAEMDCIVAISTCPNDIDPKINRGRIKPIRIQIYG